MPRRPAGAPRIGRLPLFLAAILLVASIALLADRAWSGDPAAAGPCDEPLAWHLADIDPRFGFDRGRLRRAVESAADVWEEAAGRRLFRYTPDRGMAIHLVYDERQEAYTRRRRQESELTELGETVAWHESRLERFRDVLSRDSAAYAGDPSRETAARYQASIQRFNREVERYNEATARFNRAAGEAQTEGPWRLRVGSLERQDRSIGGRTVEVRRTLTIAAVGDERQLLLTLTHELGHALGIDHVPAPGAIMAEAYRAADVPDRPRLRPADRRALAELCSAGS